MTTDKPVLNVDKHLANADWPKQTWDLPFEPDSPEMEAYVKARGMTLNQFRKLPVYQCWLKTQRKSGA